MVGDFFFPYQRKLAQPKPIFRNTFPQLSQTFVYTKAMLHSQSLTARSPLPSLPLTRFLKTRQLRTISGSGARHFHYLP